MVRFSTKFLFVVVTVVGVAFAAFHRWSDAQGEGLLVDYDVVYSGVCDVHEGQCRINLGPFSTNAERITKLQFNTNLHYLPTSAIAHYSQLKYVDTIIIMDDSTLVSDRVMGVLKAFPRLKTVITPDLARPGSRDDLYNCSSYHDIAKCSPYGFEFKPLKPGEYFPEFSE